MSSKVHKTSALYVQAKPEIDRLRAIRSHTRRARRYAQQVKHSNAILTTVKASVPDMKLKELRRLAANLAIPNRSTMNKDELVTAIMAVLP